MEPSKELEKVIESKFLTPQKFAIEIEKIVVNEELNYIDAILHYCDSNSLEIESITKRLASSKLDVFYFADSLGNLEPDNIKHLAYLIKKN